MTDLAMQTDTFMNSGTILHKIYIKTI